MPVPAPTQPPDEDGTVERLNDTAPPASSQVPPQVEESVEEPKQHPDSPDSEAADPLGDDAGSSLSAQQLSTQKGSADEASPGHDDSEGWEESEETNYEALPGGGHRVTRRTVRRRVITRVEDVEEEITEDLPPHVYRAPAPSHPSPVG